MKKWKPINYLGDWNYDPRGELLARVRRAQESHDNYVAIPIELAIACAELRECDASTMLEGDEDGPLKEPIRIFCRKPAKHLHMHYNGYISWE